MSSFESRHRIYLFDMKNGKKKLAYGPTPEKALEYLGYRLTPEEMERIVRDKFEEVDQRDRTKWNGLLG